MGNASSKAVRKLPKQKPHVPDARTTTDPSRLRPERPLAFENKHQAIERDVKDPELLQKLRHLGPVRVDHPTQTVRGVVARSDAVQHCHMYRARMQSEAEAEAEATRRASTKNRLLASSLAELLEAHKSVADHVQLETLAARYRMDVGTLVRLARVVNTPSVDQRTVVRTRDKYGEESVTMVARWVDPPYDHAT